MKACLYLWVHTQRTSSTGGTVWSGTYRSRASITVPGGRDLGKIYVFWWVSVYVSYHERQITRINHIVTFGYIQMKDQAFELSIVLILIAQGRLLWPSGVNLGNFQLRND